MSNQMVLFTAVALIATVQLSLLWEWVRKKGSKFSSFGAGIAISYVFLHIFPELSEYQNRLLEGPLKERLFYWLEHQLYLVALMGLLIFYLLEGLRSQKNVSFKKGAFIGEMFTFVVYNFVIGYLVVSSNLNHPALLMITIALSAHFFCTTIDLAEHYGDLFVRIGIPLQVGALLIGGLISLITEVEFLWVAVGFAFISGSIIMITFRIEMPKPQFHKNLGFVSGTIIYTILMLAIVRSIG